MSNNQEAIKIKLDSVSLEGILRIPEDATGLVIFAHGSGSGRLSPRNNYVAQVLQEAGFATLLFDLLTEKEDEVYETRFDIELLTQRLMAATEWILEQPETKGMVVGYFGASTGAAAAIKAAAGLGGLIKAIVSRGGRPDLAEEALGQIKAPTLLLVGGDDGVVIELNEKAKEAMEAERELVIIPGATHLFEEPGTLEEVARLAAQWFKKYLKF